MGAAEIHATPHTGLARWVVAGAQIRARTIEGTPIVSMILRMIKTTVAAVEMYARMAAVQENAIRQARLVLVNAER